MTRQFPVTVPSDPPKGCDVDAIVTITYDDQTYVIDSIEGVGRHLTPWERRMAEDKACWKLNNTDEL
jgi:hypothetical protein